MGKSKRQQDIDKANDNFDKMIREVANTANKSRMVMPLVAQSLDLTVELLKSYKEAYNVAISK